MREAIAKADVGDDMVGEDPTVNRLESRMAELLGKEAAVFACSGTQSNQMAVWTHCATGDELLIESTGHIANYEAGGPAALSGVSVRRVVGDQGRLDVADVEGETRSGNVHYAPTKLLCLENSTNLGGGRTYPLAQVERLSAWAREHGLKVHVDGARLFNACIARGYSPAKIVGPVDTVSICFSKGLGCPMGSILAGSRADIERARRARKLFGGALRQAGIPAAACLYALDHNIERLAEDHANAKAFAQAITGIAGVSVDAASVETNLVFFDLDPCHGTADDLSQSLLKRDIRMNPAGGKYRMRACLHLDVDRAGVLRAAAAVRECLTEGLNGGAASKSSAYAAR
jgi:threonine aldolase